MPPGMASSALAEKNYDLIETCDKAENLGFPYVQLYLNDDVFNFDYLGQLVESIRNSNLHVIIHLPNINLDESERIIPYLKIAESLSEEFPEKKIRTLIHYTEGMTADTVPTVNGRKVGIENSKNGTYDPGHIRRILALVNEIRPQGGFFVFDPGRFWYLNEDDPFTPEQVLEFTAGIIAQMDPATDVLHMAGKTNWHLPFRDCPCAFGIEEEIGTPIAQTVKDFSDRGGVVIFEHEDIFQVEESLKRFELLSYRIEPLQEEDILFLDPIVKRWIMMGVVVNPDARPALEQEANRTLQQMRKSLLPETDRHYYVLRDENGIAIGVAGLATPDRNMRSYISTDSPVEMVNVFLDPRHRGKGLGRRLVEEILAKAKEAGFKEVIWNSGPRYERTAWAFYIAVIGQPIDTAKDYYGPGRDAKVWRYSFENKR